MVVKTDAVNLAASLDVPRLFGELTAEFGEDLLLRAAVWMTLRESKASFAIEGEAGQRNGESDRTCHGTRQAGVHMLKLLPQPQVVLALGLRITNCAPCRLSL